ncbi:por secretion system C-terminal sorting domain [Bacteroidales bacterium 6E]|nr:por secretion system C-terminal sorting domain [Bacteroidales bacterium 6E]
MLLLLSCNAFAAFLRNVPIQLKQPDGRVIECFMTGDEYHRRLHDANDYTIVIHPVTGYYVYATTSGDELRPTEYIVGRDKPEGNPIRKGADISANLIMEKRSDRLLKSARQVNLSPNTGAVNNLVISVRFADQQAMGLPVSQYNQYFNSSTSLSLKTYYKEVSNNLLDITSHYFPLPQNNQIVEFQDGHPRSYYSPYHEVLNPIGYTPENMLARDNELMNAVVNSLKNQVNARGIDFDVNNDGVVDNIVIVFQGFPDVWGDLLWPMSGSLESAQISIGGMFAGTFNKQFSATMRPDVISHEYFHSLGAPDLYRYIDTTIEPVGAWDIMGITGAQHMTTYMKWKYGKWFNEIPEITQPGTYTLQTVSQSPFAAYRIPSPASETEFFVVEFRKKEGLLESHLPASYDDGLIIYRINTDFTGNAIGPPDEVYVYRPFGDQRQNGYIEDASFSDISKRTHFSDQTNPACLLHNGVSGMIDLSGITINGNTLSFTVNAVNPLFKPMNPEAVRTEQGVRLVWTAPAPSENHLQGYNVYLASTSGKINSALVTDTTWLAPLPGKDLHYTYHITAVYQNGESDPVSCILMNTTDPHLLDSLALVAIYNQCDGPNWARNDNWLTGPLHTWYGVGVSNDRVIALTLYNDMEHWGQPFGMRGVIPKEIGYLTELQTLNIYNSNLTGSLPPEIGNLTKLENLMISSTNLGGSIPVEIENLTELRNINLSSNLLTGNLPEEIGYLYKLTNLNLGDNRLTGAIPASYGNLSSLNVLYLMGNQLTGEIPVGIFTLPELEHMSLAGNKFSGEIPPEFYRMFRLMSINLGNSGLSGRLTPEIGNLQNLESLDLAGVYLEGGIPDELYSLSKLHFLSLANCNLSGSVSPEIGKLTNLTSIQLQHNKLTGVLPSELGSLTNLNFVWLTDNQFTGDIPQELGNLIKLWAFRADYNQLTGSLPGKFATFTELNDIDLSNNNVENMPDLRPLQNITFLGLRGNRLTFEDLESNVLIQFKPGCTGIHYDTQQKLGSPETKYALPGKPLTLSVYCGGTANQYQWFRNGQPVTEVQSSPGFALSNVVPGDNGAYFCRVTNSKVPYLVIESAPVTVIGDDRLFADAGPDFGALETSVVKLDGTGSHNPGSGAITYLWTAPEGITLDAANSPEPAFTAPMVKYPTRLVFSLTVSNEAGDTAIDEIAITVDNDLQLNEAPVANAGSDQTVPVGSMVTLDGSGSYDSDENALTFQWIVPDGIILNNDHVMNPVFTAPSVVDEQAFVVQLVVSDGIAFSDTDKVVVVVMANQPPVANAGPDQVVYTESTVVLDGSDSFDPDGSSISFFWIAPAGLVLSDPNVPSPVFTAPTMQSDSTFIFQLIVTDSNGKSDTSEVLITVRPITFSCPMDTYHEGNNPYASGGPRYGQSITIKNTGKLERIKLTIWPDGAQNAHLLLRKWHSDSYTEAFNGEIIAKSSKAILLPSINNWQEMSTFVFPDSPTLNKGEKYTIEVLNAMPYVIIPGSYTDGQAYESGNPTYVRDMRFAVYLCPDVNLPPMASVVGNMSVNEGTVVALDGTASSDPEGESLTYLWSAPDGIELSTTTDATVTFTAPDVDQATTFSFTLVVSDGNGNSEPVEVAVTVLPVYQSEEDVILCSGETYHGWEITGSYSRTLETSAGFDSIVTTHLTVLAELSVELTFSGDTLGTAGTFVGYQWYRNGDPLADATQSIYIASMSGNYKVEVTDEHGCTGSSNEVYHVYSSVHALLGALPGYTVVPNPNGGQFAFRLRNPLPGDVWLTLVSPNGQMLEQHVLHPAQMPAEHRFDVRHLSKGIYFLKVQTGQHMSTEKVVGGE